MNAEIQSIKLRFGIIGNSVSLNHAVQVALQVAPTDMTVLITGESGSGKEMFSKIIHSISPRKHNNFMAINCGAIPEGTIDSELFGHEKGSFTGASEARKGYFEEVNGGTIFLDEIGEMPLGTQARLLRVLENGEFIRVGSSKVQKTNVRVVAATNVNLLKLVERSKFREDLYFRLSTVPIYVPALRERGMDIDLLFRKFANDFVEKYPAVKHAITLNEDARRLLITYRFPGNIRQLKNLVDQISVMEDHQREISQDVLKKYLPEIQTHFLPMVVNENSKEDNFSEREILYKLLFDMRKDVTELKRDTIDLKKLVLSVMQGGDASTKSVLQQHKDLFLNLDENPANLENLPIVLNSPLQNASYEYDRAEDVTHEADVALPQNFSLEAVEKDMIVKALKKHHNKRKNAAQELGISERTLYRKLKQYDLEE